MLHRLVSELRYRWRALVRRDRLEDELDAELRFHLDQEARKLEAEGLTPDAARRRARLAFGGVEAVKEQARESRGVLLLEQTWADFRYVLRALVPQRVFTIGVAGTLALGIGANVAVFGIVDRLMFRAPDGLIDAHRVHRVHLRWTEDGRRRSERHVQFPRLLDFARAAQTFDLIAGFQLRRAALGQGEDAREGRIAVVSHGYLGFFDASPVLGRWFTADEDRPPQGAPVVVLSHPYWLARYGGRADVLGEPLQVDRMQATIVGVAPAGFTGIVDEGAPLVFVPMSAFAHAARGPGYESSYNWSWLELLVRRKPGVSEEAATADATNAYRTSWAAENTARGAPDDLAESDPSAALGSVHLGRGPDAQLDARVALWICGVAIAVFLIACANVANLFLARAVSRQRDVAMRLALGVSRGRLLRQLAMESLVLGVLGGLGGMVLAWSAGGVLRALLLPDGAGAAVMTDPRTAAYMFLLAVLAGALTVVVPSVMAARLDVAASLKAGGRGSSRPRTRTQSALVIVQAALSVVLLLGAAAFVISLQRVERHRLGLDVDRLLYAEVNLRGTRIDAAEAQRLAARILDAARAVPGVSFATMAASVPFWSNEARMLSVQGIENVRQLGRFTLQAGSADYFAATGTRILRGRGFGEADRAGSLPVIVVSDGMANALWPGQDAMGQCVRVGDREAPCRTVIGIAEESAMQSLEPSREFTYYLPVSQYLEAVSPQFFIRVAGDPSALLATVRAQLQPLLPGAAYVNVVPLREIVAPRYRAWQYGATVFTAFGVLAVLLAALGLHSLVAYDVAQRTQEFGVRVALGASPSEVMRLVVRRGTRLALVGVGVGLVLALVVSRPLDRLMFHQSMRDPAAFVGVALGLVVIACAASLLPGLRATRVDPCEALRAE